MSYVIAVLGLAAACVLWYLVQRWAGTEGDRPCQMHDAEFRAHDPHCESCDSQEPDCPSAPASPRPPPHRPH